MKLSSRLFTALAVLGGASALLGHQSAHSQTSPKVVASYSVLCDLTQQIAQDTVDVVCLIEAGEDPHLYNATPADRRAIETADLVLYGGYGFEPDIIQMVEATDGTTPEIAVSEVAVTEPLLGGHHDHGHEGEDDHDDHGKDDHHGEDDHDDHSDHSKAGHEGHDHGEEDHDDHGKEDHHGEEGHDDHGEDDHDDHGEEEGEPDPHVWHDAENGIAMVHVIEEQLIEAFPENADLYEANAESLIDQLTVLDVWIKRQIDTVPESQRVLVTTHDALGYYADAYGIRIEAALASFSTEARPSASDLGELIDVVEDSSLPSIFLEATSNPGLIEAVSRQTDIGISEEPIYADGLGEAGTPAATYIGMLMTNTCNIVTGLGGSCNEAAMQAFLD
ncbi:MAG: zinc ABC transporter solute-binding protein [Leptolyngbya sp. SIO3F4]|nr:zinc ABC transporter solute-binding protein [Leptolyngbya sp. SIO3F4]